MPFIGLTGNFGVGKTTALKLFKKLGAYTINADELVSGILKRPSIINKLIVILGKEILIKRAGRTLINKKRIADIVFNSHRKRALVEMIIHPEVIKSAKTIQKKIITKKHDAIIIFEVPLLFESGYEKMFDEIIVVYCNKDTAVNRLIVKGFSKEDALKRLQTQIPLSRKKTYANFLINNNLDISNTEKQVRRIFAELTQ